MKIDPNEKTGTTVYIRDISVSPDEPVLLALHDLLQSSSVGEFEREAFVRGWTNASTEVGKNLDTVSKQHTYMQSLRKKLITDHAYFKNIYRATFKFGLTEGARGVSVETAIDFWNQFFTAESGGIAWVTPTAPDVPWLELWIEYITTKHKRPVNKDLWNMVGEVCLKAIQPGAENLDWWNEDGAWPMAVDEFMAWIQTQAPKLGKKRANGDVMDTS
jgi:DCN1-like protein 1/2